MFEIPSSAPPHWRAVLHRPAAQSGRGGLLVPVENNRWQVNLTQMHGEPMPENVGDFIAFARTLRTQTIHDAIEEAVPIGPITGLAFHAVFGDALKCLTDFQIICCRSAM